MAANLKESRKIAVGRNGAPISDAMDAAETFVGSLELDGKTSLRMRLLTEEVLERLRGMHEDFSGLFWLESDGRECRICIDGSAEVDIAAERSLVAVSSDGKNASVRGFTAKLTRFVQHHKVYLQRLNTLMSLGAGVGAEDYLYIGATHPSFEMTNVLWSMNDYKSFLFDEANAGEQVAADRDELEKSILGNLADDIQVGVKEDRVRITVIRKL